MEWAYKTVKWGTDYFIKAHVSDNEFFGQCGNGVIDHSYWGRPEDATLSNYGTRPCYKLTTSCPGRLLIYVTKIFCLKNGRGSSGHCFVARYFSGDILQV